MVKLRWLDQIEHQYHFEDAVTTEDIFNGEIGSNAAGKFTPDEDGDRVVMQIERGDEEYFDKFPIPKGTHVRTLKLDEIVGQELEVYGYPLPATFTKGTVVGKFKVTEVLGNNIGAIVEVQA